jgi:hypothetical protein
MMLGNARRRRELLDPTVVRISKKNILTCIKSDSTGRVKSFLAAFKYVTYLEAMR